MKTLTPTRVFKPFDNIEVRLFGRNGGKTDWSIKTLVLKDILKARTLPAVYILVDRVARGAGVKTLCAPRPSEFNAQICASADLCEEIRSEAPVLTQEFSDYESMIDDPEYKEWAEREGVSIHRGVNADGCDVPKGSAFWLSSADCPTIVVWDPKTNRLICAHAGLNSLVDRKLIKTSKPGRLHESVVDAIIARFKEWNTDISRLRVFTTCGIGPIYFENPLDHPKYGKENEALYQYICQQNRWPLSLEEVVITANQEDISCKISLHGLAKTQFMGLGVPFDNIASDNIDTFSDKAPDGQPLWWSNRRGDGDKRNGVMVIHH